MEADLLVWRHVFVPTSHQCNPKAICGFNAVFNFIAVTLPSTGQMPKQQLLKQEIQSHSQELKVGGEGNETHVCIAFVRYCKHGRRLSFSRCNFKHVEKYIPFCGNTVFCPVVLMLLYFIQLF